MDAAMPQIHEEGQRLSEIKSSLSPKPTTNKAETLRQKLKQEMREKHEANVKDMQRRHGITGFGAAAGAAAGGGAKVVRREQFFADDA